jgi:hypothetical protein
MMISDPRGLQNGIGGGGGAGGAGANGGGGVAGLGAPDHGYMVLVVTSVMPNESQYQSWQTFQSHESTCPPGGAGSPGHQWVHVIPAGQLPPW